MTVYTYFVAKEPSCPIPQTHDRLNQAFSIFDDIINHYQEPEKFTTTLNNLIQALRNVTFILQAEREKIPDFDKWYPSKQDAMKSDDVMVWLNDARVHIVHRGDLEKKSYLHIKVKTHYDEVIFSEEFDPYLSTEEAGALFRKLFKLKLPEYLVEETILEVERAWIIEKYPKAEVVDILIYCLSQLVNIVYLAHEEACKVDAILCVKNIIVEPGIDFMVALHNRVKKGRICHIMYKDGSSLVQEQTLFNPTEKVSEDDETHMVRATKRYGIPKEIMRLMNTSGADLPFNNVKYHIEMAKHLFAIDGQVVMVVFLYFPDQPPIIIEPDMSQPANRYTMMEKIAEKVEETHCEAVVIVGEMWSGEMPKDGEEPIPARHQKDRKEFVSILATSPTKTTKHVIEIIREENGGATLGLESIAEEQTYPVLARIYDVWKYQHPDIVRE